MGKIAGALLSLGASLLAGAACAQTLTVPADGARPGNPVGVGLSMPRSDDASNLDSATTRSELAPNLPAPPAVDDIQTLLLAARDALKTGRTGAAQEALERAETRALDRAIPKDEERIALRENLPGAIAQARRQLAIGNRDAAIRIIDAALPQAAEADLPR